MLGILMLVLLVPLIAGAQEKKFASKAMTPAELEKAMEGKKRYDFDLAEQDGLVDAAGKVIRANELAAYFKREGMDPEAYFFLWITKTSAPTDELAPTIRPIAEHGFKNIVLGHRPGAEADNRTMRKAALKQAGRSDSSVSVIVGRPHADSRTAGQAFPDMTAREARLRPEKLPERVRYRFADDELVIAAALHAESFFLDDVAPADSAFGKSTFVFPGAWKHFDALRPKFVALKTQYLLAPGKGAPMQFDAAHFGHAEDLKIVTEKIRALIKADGGGTVRALHTGEMQEWWPFLSFDISEPALVLTTLGGKHRFILSYSDIGELVLVDDLNGLPKIP